MIAIKTKPESSWKRRKKKKFAFLKASWKSVQTSEVRSLNFKSDQSWLAL